MDRQVMRLPGDLYANLGIRHLEHRSCIYMGKWIDNFFCPNLFSKLSHHQSFLNLFLLIIWLDQNVLSNLEDLSAVKGLTLQVLKSECSRRTSSIPWGCWCPDPLVLLVISSHGIHSGTWGKISCGISLMWRMIQNANKVLHLLKTILQSFCVQGPCLLT